MENILEFYLLATKLKYVIRSGWDNKHWCINSDRLESIAEHIYGTCILAIAFHSNCSYDINIDKVLKMLVVHELEEVLIGDITPLDNISDKEKLERGHEAIKEVLKPLVNSKEYVDLILEFDEHITKESIFAYHCDKLEANLQAKYYQDCGYVSNIKELDIFNHSRVKNVFKEKDTMFDIWYKNDYHKFEDDDNFREFFEELKTKELKK